MSTPWVKQLAHLIRFMEHPTETACWMWKGYRRENGQCCYEGTTARQAVYYMVTGIKAPRLSARCRRRSCVNPNHMKER